MDTASDATATSTPLAERIRAGDDSAEEELVRTFRQSIFLIATVRTRDSEAARDITQEVLMAVLKALRQGQLRDSEKLPAFIQGTARNLINNFLRLRANRAECDLEDTHLPAPDPVNQLELAERQRLVRHEMEACSPIDQQILLWSLVDGHSLAEIAERLKMSHDSVRARKSRMIKKFKKKLAKASQKHPSLPQKRG